MPKGIEKESTSGGQRKELILPDVAHLVEFENSSLAGKETAVDSKRGQKRRLATAGMVILSLLACEGCITGPQTRDILGNLAREMSNAVSDGVRQQTQFGTEAARTKLQFEAEVGRTKLQRDAQRLRNYDDEIKAANTPERVKFINDKYGM